MPFRILSFMQCVMQQYVNINHQQSRQRTINKVIESVRNHLNESLGIRILFCYGCTHEVTHLHNVRPRLSFAAVDQSQRTAPSDQSQQWKAGFRETDSSRVV